MRNHLLILFAALTVTACTSDNTSVPPVKVEYTKNAKVLIITDELLGMNEYREKSRVEKIRRNIEREHFMLAATIWAEARGEGYDGMRAVGYVVANRIKNNFRSDGTIEGTVKWNKQFSCWNSGDPNRVKMNREYLDNSFGDELYKWETAQQIAADIMRNGTSGDITRGSIFYHADYVKPNWADKDYKSVTIGQHIFYSKAT